MIRSFVPNLIGRDRIRAGLADFRQMLPAPFAPIVSTLRGTPIAGYFGIGRPTRLAEVLSRVLPLLHIGGTA